MRRNFITDVSGAVWAYFIYAIFGAILTVPALLLSGRSRDSSWRRYALWILAVPAALLSLLGIMCIGMLFWGSPIWFDLLIVFFFLPGILVVRALLRG